MVDVVEEELDFECYKKMDANLLSQGNREFVALAQ